MVKAGRERILRALSLLQLLPGFSVVANIIAKAELKGTDRVQDPAGPPLNRSWYHRHSLGAEAAYAITARILGVP